MVSHLVLLVLIAVHGQAGFIPRPRLAYCNTDADCLSGRASLNSRFDQIQPKHIYWIIESFSVSATLMAGYYCENKVCLRPQPMPSPPISSCRTDADCPRIIPGWRCTNFVPWTFPPTGSCSPLKKTRPCKTDRECLSDAEFCWKLSWRAQGVCSFYTF